MKKYFLPIGKRQEEVLLPEEHVIYDIHGNESSVCEDVVAATTEASVTRLVPSRCAKLCMQAKL